MKVHKVLKPDPQTDLLTENARLKQIIEVQKARIIRLQRLLNAGLTFEKRK